jgi:hypothetical protein
MKAGFLDDIHLPAQCFFKIGEQTAWKKRRSIRTRLNEQIQVAVLTGLARAKDPKTRTIMTPCRRAIARIVSRWAFRNSSSVMIVAADAILAAFHGIPNNTAY